MDTATKSPFENKLPLTPQPIELEDNGGNVGGLVLIFALLCALAAVSEISDVMEKRFQAQGECYKAAANNPDLKCD